MIKSGLAYLCGMKNTNVSYLIRRYGGIVMMSAGILLMIVLFIKYRVAPESPLDKIELRLPDGQNYSIPENSGRPFMVSFFASWCGDCMKEFSLLQDSVGSPFFKGFDQYAISDENAEKIMLSKLRFPDSEIVFLQSNKPFSELGINAYPTNYVFDKNGKLVFSKVGALDFEKEYLRKVLSGE
jgi:cytochrome c biogenesis protein CcmG, thiol:disulfide interchange protein DsbE